MLADEKPIDTQAPHMLAVPAKLVDERVVKEVSDTLQLLEGAKHKLKKLLNR